MLRKDKVSIKTHTETAVFGGGCFWCTEAIFKMFRGVSSVLSGYAGGTVENPTYDQVSSGSTGHAEVIKIEYNPKIVDYRDLLTVFFGSHDPSTLNQQGADVGAQYRSAVFYTTPEQKKITEDFIKEINQSDKNGKPVVTEVVPLDKFYLAENYHQDYFARNGDNAYCELVINPKLEKVKQKFAALLNADQWREKLTPEQYRVMREGGTEMPFSGKYVHDKRSGQYVCSACGNPLFASDAKFDSGTGWPSFDEALPGAVETLVDDSIGTHRTEIVCAKCHSHLGHVFDDGPTKTGKRYCLNSVCLDLKNDQNTE